MLKLPHLFTTTSRSIKITRNPNNIYNLAYFKRTMATESPTKRLKTDAPLIGTHK
jgi:hypothetical protein